MIRIQEILDKVAANNHDANLELIQKAYVFAATAHAGQTRLSGEPYLSHPLAVAYTLADMGFDEPTVAAGLLHDTVEDTGTTIEEIDDKFGEDVADIVDGVTKISMIVFENKEEAQAENIRKMILAMSHDMRVLMVKLADRLHNMSTLDFQKPHKQRRIAQETMDIYAPLANRLGLYLLKRQLEDLSFKYLRPDIYNQIDHWLDAHQVVEKQIIEKVVSLIQDLLASNGLEGQVYGRIKHKYSIYKKMQSQSLTLDEMYQAFDAVWPADPEDPALELVGFDTCLMATVDVAATFQNFAKYLVASEETEPGNGWLYSGWAGALAENPAMDGQELGTVICDTYYEGCQEAGTEDQTTLSLTDLTQLTPLLDAYEAFGQEALTVAAQDPAFFAELGRAASQSENYGGNTREQGFTNMVDLGDLARKSSDLLDSAQAVTDALSDCVLYQVGGIYRAQASGLSCYYSYNGDTDDLDAYSRVGTGQAFKSLYTYELTGQLDESEVQALPGIQELQDVVTLKDMNWDDAPLDLNDDGNAVLTLGPQANDVLASIGFSLMYVDEENDQMLYLGTDNDMTADWDNGVFYDNFRGVWGAIDGHIVYMELSYEGDDYNLYSVPILLNDEEYNLQVAYNFTDEAWSILGAAKGLDADSGMASKELRLLEAGDKITTIWMAASYSGDDDFEMYTAEELTVTDSTSFGEAELPDGSYAMVFEMWDAMGNDACSDAVTFDCENGEIWTTVYE